MKRLPGALGMALLFVSGGFADAAQPPQPSATSVTTSHSASAMVLETREIQAYSEAFVAAFNAGDAAAIGAMWTETSDYTDVNGGIVSGRKLIEKQYADFFQANPRARIDVVIESIKLLSDTAAVETGKSFLKLENGSTSGCKYTAIHVKVNGKWLMSSVRDEALTVTPAEQASVDLDWLIGTWTAEEHGNNMESQCRWISGKRFVERNYNVAHADGTSGSGVQVIGWNPVQRQVESWNFNSDGSVARGVWMPVEGGWRAEFVGVTSGGLSTRSVNVFHKLDENAYSWQSVGRVVDGKTEPDTQEVVVRRVVK